MFDGPGPPAGAAAWWPVKASAPHVDTLGMEPTGWRLRGRYLAGLPLLVLFGWNAFVRGVRVPLLGWIDLAIHEAGHVFAFPLPDIGMAVMGSGLQVAMPLLFAVVFWMRERDVLGTALTLGWAGTSFQDASVYIADAPYQRLQLIGGEHDWAWVLGPRGVDQLALADELARTAWLTGLLLWTAGLALCLAGPRLGRAIHDGHRDLRPWRLWALAPSPEALVGWPRVPSRDVATPDLPPAAARGPAGVAVAPAHGAGGPDHPAAPGGAAPGGVDPGGPGDPARPRVLW